MEKEIDDLFLNDNDTGYTDKTIQNLENSVHKFESLSSYFNLIKDKISNIDINAELYNVKLERLANEMKDIEDKNTKLENEILYQTSIYETLKDLLIKLEIKEEHFINLETESFTGEGLIKIEEAVEALENFFVTDFTIRVVTEKQQRVNATLIMFYNRFINFISNLLKNDKSTEDFKVHSELYQKLERYKYLYKMSERYDKIYAKLCNLYVDHARIKYERELVLYLKKLYDLNIESTTKSNLEQSVQTVLETYQYILKVENNFLCSMNIKTDLENIFTKENQMIYNFFKDLYNKYNIEIICYLNNNIKDTSKDIELYKKFQDELIILVGKLKKNFLQNEAELKDAEKGVERFEKYVKLSDMEDFNNILLRINISRIKRNLDKADIFNVIAIKRLFDKLQDIYECNCEEYHDAIKESDKKLEKTVIDYVFEDGDEIEQIKKIQTNIKGTKIFVKKIKSQIFDIIKSNLKDDKKKLAKDILLE